MLVTNRYLVRHGLDSDIKPGHTSLNWLLKRSSWFGAGSKWSGTTSNQLDPPKMTSFSWIFTDMDIEFYAGNNDRNNTTSIKDNVCESFSFIYPQRGK